MGKQKILPKRLDYLEANTPSCRFRINVDVINECFGANSSLYMKASYPSDNYNNFRELNSDIRLFAWLPKLFSNSSEWKNTISADEEFIYEDAEDSRTQDWIPTGKHPLDHYRLVFAKATLKDDYVFKGIYKSEKMENLHHVYKRVATKAKLIGNPVHTIEIIYDSNSYIGSDSICFTKRDEQNRSTIILNEEKIGRVHFRKNDAWLNPYDYSLINIDEIEKLGLRVEKNPNSKDYPIKIYINSADEATIADILTQVCYHKDNHDIRLVEATDVLEDKDTVIDDAMYLSEIDKNDDEDAFQEYIPKRMPKPESIKIAENNSKYKRDVNVARFALKRADFKCEFDNGHTSFIRASRDEQYMEPHHLIPLSQQELFEYSLDVPANIVSLCSTCHNCIHYGKDSYKLIENLFENRKDELERAGIYVSLDALKRMYL